MPIELGPRRAPACLSDLALDEWLAGEGSLEARAAWQAHVASCPACQARRERRGELNQRYIESSRDLELAAQRRATPGRSSAGAAGSAWRRARGPAWAVASAALALAAGVALFLRAPLDTTHAPSTRSKGGARLDFYVKSGGSVRPGSPGEIVRAGDALRFVVPRGESRFLLVLGRDSRGVTSVYYPAGLTGQRPPAPSAGSDEPAGAALGGLALDSSVVLDDAPGVERFYAVFCDGEPSTASWRDELAKSGRLAPRDGCEVAETSITKATP